MNSNHSLNAILELDLDPIKVKLMHVESGEGWSRAKADAVEKEYRRFLYLMTNFPAEQTSPLVDVDTFWHYHILDTMKYAADCEQAFGYFLHHFPYVGMRGEEDEAARQHGGERMRELYEAAFGESYAQAAASMEQPAAAFCGATGTKAAFCGATGVTAAFCGATGVKAAFCGATGVKAAFCGATGAQSAFCGATGVTAAFCGATGVKAAFCGATGAQSAFCGATGIKAAFCGATGTSSAFCGATGVKATFCGATGAQSAFCGAGNAAQGFCGAVGKVSTSTVSTNDGFYAQRPELAAA